MIKTEVLIIGAGLSGLSTAYHLEGKKNYILIEKENKVGGLASSIEKNGFIFDYSGHLLHLRNEYAKKLIFRLLKKNLFCLERNSWIYLSGVYIPYPFQVNLFNLPQKIKSECVSDFIKACISHISQRSEVRTHVLNFHKWALSTFGRGICKYFMFPYNAKLWQYPLNKLTAEWCNSFVPVPSLNEVLEGAYLKEKTNIGYNPIFYYPRKGGIQTLSDAFARHIKNLRLNCELMNINLKNKTAYVKNLGHIKYKYLVNTSSLKDFISKIEKAPKTILKASSKLKANSVYVLNLGAKNVKSKIHWVYYPEKLFPFYRVGIASNFSKYVSPPSQTSFYIEISSRPLHTQSSLLKQPNRLDTNCVISSNGQPLQKTITAEGEDTLSSLTVPICPEGMAHHTVPSPTDSTTSKLPPNLDRTHWPHVEQTEKTIIKSLLKCGLLKSKQDITEKLWLYIPCAYVIYDMNRSSSLAIIFKWLISHSVFSIGRYGAWKYSFMEENILDGKQTAEKILQSK